MAYCYLIFTIHLFSHPTWELSFADLYPFPRSFDYINYPDFFQGHSSYLTCLSEMENFEACGEFLTFLVNEGYAKIDLVEFVEELDENGENELNNLIKSKVYQNWKKEE